MVSPVKLYLIALIVLCILCESAISQRRKDDRKRGSKGKPKQRGRGGRGRQQPEEEQAVQRTNCYFCSVNFYTTKLDTNNLCYNPGKNFTAADAEYLSACPGPSRFCSVDIIRVGGGLVGIDRKCGGNTCNYFCIIKGYGVEVETCTFCCPGKPIIDESLLEEGQVIPPYKCP